MRGRHAAMLSLLALLAAAPVLGQDKPRVVEMVSPLPAELRALAQARYFDDPDVARNFPNVRERRAAIDALEGTFADLDDDGQPEAFLQESGLVPGCGTVGCWVTVFKKEGGQWRVLGGFPDKDDKFLILPQKNKGFHWIRTYGWDRGVVTDVDLAWDGERFNDPPGTDDAAASDRTRSSKAAKKQLQ